MLTEEQRLNRASGLGASDTPIIMGYSSYKTPYELYLEKLGLIEPEPETELQYWGNQIEPLIVKRFAEVNNVSVEFPDTIYHPEHSFIFANLDGWCPELEATVEAKMANSFQRKEWDSAYQDGIPLNYLIQVAKQVGIKQCKRGYCAVLIGGNEYLQFLYERDKELEELIWKADMAFWDGVQNLREPELKNIEDCKLKFRQPMPESRISANFAVQQSCAEIKAIKERMKLMEADIDKHKMAIMQYMKEAECLVDFDGKQLATWKATKKGNRVLLIKEQ